MSSKTRSTLFSVITVFIFVLNMATPLSAYADDGAPPVDVPTSEPGVSQDNPAPQASASEPASSEPAAVQDDPSPAAPASEPASSEPAVVQDDPSPEAPATEPASSEPAVDPEAQSTPDPATVSDILEQLPAETQVAVINQDGNVEPLATNEAADILISGDPYFNDGTQNVGYSATGVCAGAVLPANCHTVANPIQAAIDAYQAAPAATGSIIVEADNYNENVSINAAMGSLAHLTGLTGAGSGTTILNGSITVTNLSNPFTLSGFQVVRNTNTNGISISGNADIILSDVVVTTWPVPPNPALTGGSGAVLNNCNYSLVSGTCTTTGNVSVTNSQFNNNHDNGLYIDSGGNITLDTVTTQNNGINGAELWAFGTTPTVNDSDLNHSKNHGNGLKITTTGSAHLTNVTAGQNTQDGAFVDASGDVTITDGTFGSSASPVLTGNGYYGLDIFSTGNITLEISALGSLSASDNGKTGAYLDARGGPGNISVSDGQFDSNTEKGLLALSDQGNIDLLNVFASDNGIYGAYLNATGGPGNIMVDTSQFNNNADKGLYAITSTGDITLSSVTVDGMDNTDVGAWIKTYNGGDILVQDSTFINNTGPGLIAISSGTLTLNNVTATDNGSNGVEAYSTYSYACFGPTGIVVTVDGGTYQNNGGYGLYVSPGPAGSLVFTPPAPTFGGNIPDDYVLDLSDHCLNTDPGPKEEKPPKKPVKEVDLPATGGTPVPQDCDAFSGTLLNLPNGDSTKVNCDFAGDSVTETLDESQLPHDLPTGSKYISAQSVNLTTDGQPVEKLTDGASLTISFKIPEGINARSFSIMYWDPTANNGAGGWVELPLFHLGRPGFPLHPGDPDDGRSILKGVRIVDGVVTVTVNFPGIFALIAH